MPPQDYQPNPSQQIYGQPMPAPTVVQKRRPPVIVLVIAAIVILVAIVGGIFLTQRNPSASSLKGDDKARAEAVDSLFSQVEGEAAAKGGAPLTNDEFNALYNSQFESYTDPGGGIFGINGHKEELLINNFYYGLVDEDTYELCTKLSSGKLYCQKSD